MLGFKDLKESINVTDKSVECPVKGCGRKVKRRKDGIRRRNRFKCPEHDIYISPYTFEYERDMDNLLWRRYEDLYLLNRVKRAGAESRMAREDSEEAVVWNVFRFLDLQDLLVPVFNILLGVKLDDPVIIYWSYHKGEKGVWSELVGAGEEFGENMRRAPGPDIIIDSRDTLIFIEAKLTADNQTVPPTGKSTKKYLTGGQYWFSRVFRSDYETVAVKDRMYELTRLWLLGTRTAARKKADFYLLNLVREGREEDIEVTFGRHIREDPARMFLRITWEGICRGIEDSCPPGEGRDKISDYFENKTLGYDGDGRLRKAFQA